MNYRDHCEDLERNFPTFEESLSESPFDFEEPNIVWRCGVCVDIPRKVIGMTGLAILVFLSEQDALDFVTRFAKYIICVFGSPYQQSYNDAVSEASRRGRRLLILDGKGNEVCR